MSCDFSGTLLHAYLDGELDAMRAAEFERHLETCRECTATLGAAIMDTDSSRGPAPIVSSGPNADRNLATRSSADRIPSSSSR